METMEVKNSRGELCEIKFPYYFKLITDNGYNSVFSYGFMTRNYLVRLDQVINDSGIIQYGMYINSDFDPLLINRKVYDIGNRYSEAEFNSVFSKIIDIVRILKK